MAQTLPPAQPLPDWVAPPALGPHEMAGGFVTLQPLDADRHAAQLHAAFAGHDALWDYMSYGPFSSSAAYHRWVKDTQGRADPVFFALCDSTSGEALGVASWLRIEPNAGSVEIGHICLSPQMQQTPAATEAFFLMTDAAFRAGYRRVEWKCNARNLASRSAAQRLGFSFEGVFRNHMVIKGCNRDTAWFSVIDSEWPALYEAFSLWLSPANFDTEGHQLERLSDLTALGRAHTDPAL